MRAMIRAALATLMMVLASPVLAAWPDSGWYWNPNEGGRGVAIEVQDNKIFLAIYTYETTGAPVYYYAAGTLTGDRSFSETLYKTANGQCVGCTYRAPTSIPVGSFTITFTTDESATLTALGSTLTLQRFDFSSTNLFNPGALYGEWSTTEGDPGFAVFFGDRFNFSSLFTGSDGNLYGRGTRSGDTARVSIGRCVNRGVCVIAFSYTSTSDEYYTFSMDGFNRMEGLLQVVPAGGSPVTGAGFYFVAHRTKSRAFVQTGVGPAISKHATDAALLEATATAKRSYASVAPKRDFAPQLLDDVAGQLLREVAGELATMKAADALAQATP